MSWKISNDIPHGNATAIELKKEQNKLLVFFQPIHTVALKHYGGVLELNAKKMMIFTLLSFFGDITIIASV